MEEQTSLGITINYTFFCDCRQNCSYATSRAKHAARECMWRIARTITGISGGRTSESGPFQGAALLTFHRAAWLVWRLLHANSVDLRRSCGPWVCQLNNPAGSIIGGNWHPGSGGCGGPALEDIAVTYFRCC